MKNSGKIILNTAHKIKGQYETVKIFKVIWRRMSRCCTKFLALNQYLLSFQPKKKGTDAFYFVCVYYFKILSSAVRIKYNLSIKYNLMH